jgi:hypothetical protein
VDLAGVKLALVADWPGNFHHGNGKARLYFDPAVSAEQQTAIRAIFEGGVEGPVPAMWSAVISEWLSPSVTEVNINWDQNTVSIAGVGESTMTALTDADGNQAHMCNSVAQVEIGVDRLDLMSVDGSTWADPDIRLHRSNLLAAGQSLYTACPQVGSGSESDLLSPCRKRLLLSGKRS